MVVRRLGWFCAAAWVSGVIVSVFSLLISSMRCSRGKIRLSAGDDQLFFQHRFLPFRPSGIGSLRRSQPFIFTGRPCFPIKNGETGPFWRDETRCFPRWMSSDWSRKARHWVGNTYYEWRLPLAAMSEEWEI
ncbi:hypothetical protein N657DRAFT_660300 [Parathielavia appendiculata]|uniref:Uncharacterized protein n=1 Tax=Parathielavia appendiculata TaxID=2587402 RepID=A0AAN6Z8Z8_9PEZI|nr:hypothetical protein N657DRAFT_660300 [Parathielavia appendiculata]